VKEGERERVCAYERQRAETHKDIERQRERKRERERERDQRESSTEFNRVCLAHLLLIQLHFYKDG
jgi:hypothetical protein